MTTDHPTIAALLTPLAPGGIAVLAIHGNDTDCILGKILRFPEGASHDRGTGLSCDCGADVSGGCGSDVSRECGTGVPPVLHHRPETCDTAFNDPSNACTTGTEDFSSSPRKRLHRLLPDHQPTLCQLVDDGSVLDDVVVVRIPCGDTAAAEINTHGGVRIAQRTLMLLERYGAQIVDAEKFVARSVSAHPIEHDCDEALIRTCSLRLTQWLLVQRRNLPSFLDRFDSLDPAQQAAFRERSRIAMRLISGFHVAIIGPPNVGKSTLANRLIGRDRVLTSDQPGTTRDWVSETVLIKGWPVTLTDTAGIRDTRCDIEAEAIRRARRQAELADVVVIVLDATTSPNEQLTALRAVLETARFANQDHGPDACTTNDRFLRGSRRKLWHRRLAGGLTGDFTSGTPVPQFGCGQRTRCDTTRSPAANGERDKARVVPESSSTDRPRVVALNKCDVARHETTTMAIELAKLAESESSVDNMRTDLRKLLPISALTGAGVEDLESSIHTTLGLNHLKDDLPAAFLPHQFH